MSDQQEAQISSPQDADKSALLEQKSHKIAHQLNNVLGIIRGNVEMLSCEAEFSEKAHKRLEKINDAVDKAADLVSRIYEFEFHIENQNKGAVQVPGKLSGAQNKRVLIVDDEEDLVEIVACQLQFRGYETLSATSAEQALEILSVNKAVDVLFSDIVMKGGMNGLQLAKRVHEKYPNTKILLTTGHTQRLEESQSEDLYNALLTTRLNKPYTYQELIAAIEELVNC